MLYVETHPTPLIIVLVLQILTYFNLMLWKDIKKHDSLYLWQETLDFYKEVLTTISIRYIYIYRILIIYLNIIVNQAISLFFLLAYISLHSILCHRFFPVSQMFLLQHLIGRRFVYNPVHERVHFASFCVIRRYIVADAFVPDHPAHRIFAGRIFQIVDADGMAAQ